MDTLRMDLTLAGKLARFNGYTGRDKNITVFLEGLSEKVGVVIVTYKSRDVAMTYANGKFVRATDKEGKPI